MLKQKFTELLEKPMTRREFLRNLGLLFLGIIGIHSALTILSEGQPTQIVNQHIIQQPRGFGGGKFGV